ncbi:hypothetical protein [Pseudomonas sp. NPDC090208]|uniref:hypothetical protein n=1 Tax=Pseudomonas sp. NPDC090208 TaxID=3364478 RepID=UPI003809D415
MSADNPALIKERKKIPTLVNDLSLIIDGHEGLALLIFKFPLPFPGSGSGEFAMYETVSGLAHRFFEASPQELTAKVADSHGRVLYHLAGLSFSEPSSSVEWAQDPAQTPVVVRGRMYWRQVNRMTANESPPPDGLLGLLKARAR